MCNHHIAARKDEIVNLGGDFPGGRIGRSANLLLNYGTKFTPIQDKREACTHVAVQSVAGSAAWKWCNAFSLSHVLGFLTIYMPSHAQAAGT